ncbi:hypothetical protein QPB21_004650 [Vibrio alginolyticus]|uniref:hypothetical protein n=1 Tax=Vibrio alginolyticus TaxID=663 RepID=UPI001EBAEE84|nr:hypothetical protein [Vibrio alginolyticus]EGR0722801.1 hypothetical protein [Vibrio alginolyticus]ELA7328092.1 hypothetical protein [Vibrio alginolyticus]ELB1642122.1 hypothetical protein [Vibrio alginolyticus]MCR9373488.1 hypothetical protein [Vibrio alginolyticus]MCR9408191.1 hypothetical protein [Vibrio alginolyticus]
MSNKNKGKEVFVYNSQGSSGKIKTIFISVLASIVGLLMGVIGILLAVNTYVIDLENKKDDLEKLLYNAEVSSDYGMRFKTLDSKMKKLESYLYSIEEIQPYYDIGVKVPTSIVELRKLISEISDKDSTITKNELVEYITQDDSEQLSNVAAAVLLEKMTRHDVDILVKIAIQPNRDNIYEYQHDLAKKLANYEFYIFERAWLKYYMHDELMASFLLKRYLIYNENVDSGDIHRLLSYAKANNLVYTSSLLGEYLLSN